MHKQTIADVPLNDQQAAEFPLIDISGDSYQRGLQLGTAASKRIKRSLQNYQTMFATCDITWAEASETGLACLEFARDLLPEIVTELEGMAKGADVDLASIAALNARTEILPANYLQRASGVDAAQLTDNGALNECTALSLKLDSEHGEDVWLAQSWDWLGLQREAMGVVRANNPDNGSRYLTVSEAGMLAKIGINNHGLGITLNILRSADDGKNAGLPVHLFLRGLLDCKNVSEAKALAAKGRFASSSNVLVADKSGAMAAIEICPSGAKIIEPDSTTTEKKSNQWLCHTNHFLHSELAGRDVGLTGNISTESRLQTAMQGIGDIKDQADIENLLADTRDGLQSICRFADESLPVAARIETVCAVTMKLNAAELWTTAAQPSISPFIKHTLH